MKIIKTYEGFLDKAKNFITGKKDIEKEAKKDIFSIENISDIVKYTLAELSDVGISFYVNERYIRTDKGKMSVNIRKSDGFLIKDILETIKFSIGYLEGEYNIYIDRMYIEPMNNYIDADGEEANPSFSLYRNILKNLEDNSWHRQIGKIGSIEITLKLK